MKKWLSYICIMIFSFQVIPVKEIGKILFKGQVEEEVHNCLSSEDGTSKLKKEGDTFYHNEHAQAIARVEFLTRQIRIAIETECLPQDYNADILTPPPNRV